MCKSTKKPNLHSNMVRFIIIPQFASGGYVPRFTFQYGQIYYKLLKKNLETVGLNLHSNMVRFIMKQKKQEKKKIK